MLNTKIDNLGAAIEHGGQIAALVERFAERQKERNALRTEMASAEILYQIAVDRPKIEAEVQEEVAYWRGLLASAAVVDGREFLRKVLASPTGAATFSVIRCRVPDRDGRSAATSGLWQSPSRPAVLLCRS